MKVGGGLVSKDTHSSVLRVWACHRVSGYPSIKKFKILMLKDAMTGHLTDVMVQIQITC